MPQLYSDKDSFSEDEDDGDVNIIIKGGSDTKLNSGTNGVYAFCNHCKRDISVVYIKSQANGVETMKTVKTSNSKDNDDANRLENDYDKCTKDNDYESCRRLIRSKKKKEKLRNLFTSFLDSCTLHGFHYCFTDKPLRRVIWTLLLLGAFGLFFEKCTDSFMNFFQYPFTTTTLLVYENKLQFPAITICNYNDARLSKMNGTLMERIFVGQQILGLNVSHLKGNLSGELMAETLTNAAHRLEDMVVECKWSEQPCSYKNFTQFKNAKGDVCYTFNSGKNSEILSVTNTGEDKGLRLVINVQHYEYYYDVENAGFKVILHDQEETPVKMQGLSVAPGFTTYMELKKKKITNLEEPYKTKCGMPPLKYFDTYSKSKCFLDKLTTYVVSHCKCRDWFMPGDVPFCDYATSLTCMWPAWEHFQNKKLDNCPVACESYEYSAQLSYAIFPANRYSEMLARKLKLTGSVEENKQFLRDNFLELKIYFEDLTYYDVKQVPSYDVFSLLGDIGGQIGLFLGASLLTIVEYIDLLAMMILTHYKYR